MKIKLLYMGSGGCIAVALLAAGVHSSLALPAFIVAVADYSLAEFLSNHKG